MFFEIFVIISLGIYLYAKWKFTYWKRKGVPFQEPKFPFGTYGMPTRSLIHPGEIIKGYYHHFKSLGHKHFGVYLSIKPVYIVIDPEIIKQILVKDYHHFQSRGFYYNAKDDPISASFAFLEGQEWKFRRQQLTSAFSPAKSKMVFPILDECTDKYISALGKLTESGDAINIKIVLEYLTTNAIGTGWFGFECKNYEDKNNKFIKYGKKYFKTLTPFQILKWLIAYTSKSLARYLKITLLPKDATEFFHKVFIDTAQFRERTKFCRPDLMQHLIELRNERLLQANEKEKFSLLYDQMMAADAFLLQLVGLESSASAINFCLFELAVHPNIQGKVRDEVKRVTENDGGKFTYENLMEMKYLNQVVDESIRKYPTTPVLTRICTKDCNISNTNVVIEKGTYTVIPVLALHYDPEYFPDPEEFNPNRFNESNKANIPPFTYLPFGEGPRTCIAARFGHIFTKLAVAATVKNFSFALNKKTSPAQPFDPLNHSFSFKNTIFMDIKKL